MNRLQFVPAGLILLVSLVGCNKDAADSAADATIEIISPEDGVQVAPGDVNLAVVVEGFTLVTPAKHEEGEALAGWIIASVDGADVGTDGDTQLTVTLAEVGVHTVAVRLELEDGDPIDPPAEDAISVEVLAP